MFVITSDNFRGKKYQAVDIEKSENAEKKTFTIFGNTRARKILLRITFATLKLLLVFAVLLFVVFPIIFKLSYTLQRAVVFLNFVNLPKNSNYKNPESYNIDGVLNRYVSTEDGISLGVWHILHENVPYPPANESTAQYFDKALADGSNVILYNHGNAGSRATPHRIDLYRILRKHFHVIAYDYRSYGDSSNVGPTEDGVVSDSAFMIRWILSKMSPKGKLFVWGHSLGTSITVRSVASLRKDGVVPSGIILESPFNNLGEEISEFPLARLFRNLPWFSYTVVDSIQDSGFTFKSDFYIKNVDCPILILHALDDKVVPYKLGYKLFTAANHNRKSSQGSVKLISFEAKLGFGHKNIWKAQDIHNIITNFVNETNTENLAIVDMSKNKL